MQRSPSYRWWLAAIFPSSPMAWSWVTARGVRPSPHVFSRGNVFFSTITTSRPARPSQCPAAAPAGPPPMTSTSWRWAVVTRSVCRSGQAHRQSSQPTGSAWGQVLLGDAHRGGDLAQPRLGEGGLPLGDLQEQQVLLGPLLQLAELHS